MVGNNNHSRRLYLKTVGLSALGLASIGSVSATGAASTVSVPEDYASIQAAVDAVAEGGTVAVEPGVYNEQVRVGKSVTILGDPGGPEAGAGADAPVLDGGGAAEAMAVRLHKNGQNPDNVVIRGFEIQNYGTRPASGEWGGGIGAGGGNDAVTVADCYIHDIGASGVAASGVGRVSHSDWTVERNILEGAPESAIRFDHVSNAVIRNNVIRGGSVTDDGSWEANRTDTDPDKGIELHTNTQNGESSTQENVLIEDNRVEGPFETAGIYLLAINKNDPSVQPDTLARLRNVTIRNNDVRNLGSSRGVALGVNPVQGAPTKLQSVTIHGNTIRGGSIGIHCGSGAEEGLVGVDAAENDIQECFLGILATARTANAYRDVRITGSDIRENSYGIVALGDVDNDRLVVRQSNLLDNEQFAVANLSTGRVDARRTYWGSPSGPTRPAGPIASAPAAKEVEERLQELEKLSPVGHGNGIWEATAEVFVTPWLANPT